MTYSAFLARVRSAGWSLAELRCDTGPPEEELLELMTAIGLRTYESYVGRLASDIRKGIVQCPAN